MFGRRSDGVLVKTIDPIMKLTPHIMPDRNDAQVMSMYEINCKAMDEYIFKQRKENQLRFSYMHILIAAMLRTVALHPKLNRFVINRRVYKRNTIQISFIVKKALVDNAEESTIKMTFDGTENIFKTKEMMDKEIEANTKTTSFNDTDALAKWLTIVPMRFVVGLLKFMDKHGILPKSIINLSPFHTSVFLTNLKSIKMNYAYHHIYNFGSTSIFVAMGKEKYEPVVLDHDEEKIGSAKIMKAGVVIDERICDGLYYGNSMREFMKLVANPALLEVSLEKKIEDQK
ncbi:MAG: 2-oxoglutarate dehydrogenase [Firmicutes bacterium]|nr:2-oxoglutarate dehydrogenase [Bacillota bacterium]